MSNGSSTGQDVAGTINGIEATGKGQLCVGIDGETSEGLSVLVTSENTPVPGYQPFVDWDKIHDALNTLTDSVDGTLADKQDFLENEIISSEERVEDIDSNLAIRRQRMEAEFLGPWKIMAEFRQEQFLAKN